MSKYLDLYPDTFSGSGLLSAISEIESCPWFGSVDKTEVELQYSVTSAQKQIVTNFENISENLRPKIVLAFYIDKWKRLYETYKLQYTVLSPYSVSEMGHHSQVNVREETQNFGGNTRETGSNTGTVGNSETSKRSDKASIYGFNSTESSPSDDSIMENSGQNTETRNLSSTRTLENGGSDSFARNDDETHDYTVDKSGNLGFITSQDIIEKEFNVWATPFFKRIFEDVNSLIALKIY